MFELGKPPSITRVHTLHRIRTVVNCVVDLVQNNAPEIDDITIANHLISTHLSKPTIKSFGDQIGRRARDHLETARYLGLLYRIKTSNKYKHLPTLQGKKLAIYTFEETCPKDFNEEAIFIDRICRMKMTNTSYMQTPRGYEHYRSRICLNMLAALEIYGSKLSLFQIGSVVSEPNLDVFKHKGKIKKLVKKITSKSYDRNYLINLTQEYIRNIRRDVTPFIDWRAQLDLIRTNNDNINLTHRGANILNFYGKFMPIWWHDLSEWPSVAGASLLLINYLKLINEHLAIKQLLQTKIRIGLFEVEISDVLQQSLKEFYKTIIQTETLVDFSFQYDVPPEKFKEVEQILVTLLKILGYKNTSKDIINFLELYFEQKISSSLKTEADIKTTEIKKERNIDIKIAAASTLSQFKSPYEATTYLFLKAIETQTFKTEKYQAQLGDFFKDDLRWGKFSENNPDLLLVNDFYGLIECKSSGEWGDYLNLRKGILSEIANYHAFCNAIKTIGIKRDCVVVFSYEGKIKIEDKNKLGQLLKKEFPNVIIVTQQALKKALVDISFQNTLRGMIKGKEKHSHIIDI